jgi:hypothetical protein
LNIGNLKISLPEITTSGKRAKKRSPRSPRYRGRIRRADYIATKFLKEELEADPILRRDFLSSYWGFTPTKTPSEAEIAMEEALAKAIRDNPEAGMLLLEAKLREIREANRKSLRPSLLRLRESEEEERNGEELVPASPYMDVENVLNMLDGLEEIRARLKEEGQAGSRSLFEQIVTALGPIAAGIASAWLQHNGKPNSLPVRTTPPQIGATPQQPPQVEAAPAQPQLSNNNGQDTQEEEINVPLPTPQQNTNPLDPAFILSLRKLDPLEAGKALEQRIEAYMQNALPFEKVTIMGFMSLVEQHTYTDILAMLQPYRQQNPLWAQCLDFLENNPIWTQKFVMSLRVHWKPFRERTFGGAAVNNEPELGEEEELEEEERSG